MSALADECNAVNLSQGFPDFDGPDEIKKIAADTIIKGSNQYVPSHGLSSLRTAVARKMKRFYGVDANPDTEITVTAGATEGLCATLLGILEPGDEVILLEPAYDAYAPVASIAGAVVRYISLEKPGFTLPEKELQKTFNDNTKAIVINNPQNPCGKVFTLDELEFIGELCSRYNAFAIGDEVYEHLVYDGLTHTSLLSVPGLRDRAATISSTAKTFSMTGWKIGYVVAAPKITEAVRMSHQFITFCTPAAFQEAMAHAINMPDSYYDHLLVGYTTRRKQLIKGLESAGFDLLPFNGAYYVLADITSFGANDDLEFCKRLAREAGVAAIPASFFWKDRKESRHLVRFCFCKQATTIDKAVQRLKGWKP